MSKDDKKGWVVKARRCSNDAQQHRLLNGELPSAKTELASPNGPRTLCHPPLSSTDRHGRLVDYHLHCAKIILISRVEPEIGWSSVVFHQEIQDVVSGNGFRGFLSQNGIRRIGAAQTRANIFQICCYPSFLGRRMMMAMCFRFDQNLFLSFFLGALNSLGGPAPSCVWA